jgi:hypothetical protein
MNFKSNSARLVALAAVAIGLSLSNTANARDVTQPTGDTSKAGGSCTVTSGTNKGKTGTYENFEGSLYCSGGWGSTGCVTQTGGSQCKDAGRIRPLSGTLPIFTQGTFSFTR